MVCIYCQDPTRVINSRPQKRLNQVWRRRRCQTCGASFTTHERLELANALMVKNGSKLTPLEPAKLLISLYKSCQHRTNAASDASALADTCLAMIQRRTSNGIIAKTDLQAIIQEVLGNFDQAASTHYQAFHQA